jgi:hypothetical protein
MTSFGLRGGGDIDREVEEILLAATKLMTLADGENHRALCRQGMIRSR